MRNGLRKKDLVLIAVILCVAGLTVLVHRFVGGVGANRVIVKIEGAIEGIYGLGRLSGSALCSPEAGIIES